MKRHARKAFDTLKGIGCPVIETDDYGHFVISAEDNSNDLWADYYEGYRLERVDEATGEIVWAFGINPKIHKALDEAGLYAEWINPGMLGVYDV